MAGLREGWVKIYNVKQVKTWLEAPLNTIKIKNPFGSFQTNACWVVLLIWLKTYFFVTPYYPINLWFFPHVIPSPNCLTYCPLPACFQTKCLQSCPAFLFALSSFARLVSYVSKFTILCTAKIFTSCYSCTDIRRALPYVSTTDNMTGQLIFYGTIWLVIKPSKMEV